MCVIGYRLVQSRHSVLFIPAYRLVQDMLAAKRDLEMPRIRLPQQRELITEIDLEIGLIRRVTAASRTASILRTLDRCGRPTTNAPFKAP